MIRVPFDYLLSLQRREIVGEVGVARHAGYGDERAATRVNVSKY